MKKYLVRNKLTNAVCGVFDTPGEAGKWVEVYTHEQNEGLDPNDEGYCSPFHFSLNEECLGDVALYTSSIDFAESQIAQKEAVYIYVSERSSRAVLALDSLLTKAEEWNREDGFVPDFSDENQHKYFPWFEYKGGTAGFVYATTDWTATTANIGSRLCFSTRERAIAFGRQFESVFNDFLMDNN